jgi:hypothetical protein
VVDRLTEPAYDDRGGIDIGTSDSIGLLICMRAWAPLLFSQHRRHVHACSIIIVTHERYKNVQFEFISELQRGGCHKATNRQMINVLSLVRVDARSSMAASTARIDHQLYQPRPAVQRHTLANGDPSPICFSLAGNTTRSLSQILAFVWAETVCITGLHSHVHHTLPGGLLPTRRTHVTHPYTHAHTRA